MQNLSLEASADTIPEIISIEEMSPEYAADMLAQSPDHSVGRVKTLRARHHRVAKLLATESYRYADVARMTGFSPSTISALMTNPAFQDLVEHYKSDYAESVDEMHERLNTLAFEMIEVLEEKLDSPEKRQSFKPDEIRGILTDLLDRTGRGPVKRVEKTSRSERVNLTLVQTVKQVAAGRRFDPAGRGQALVGPGADAEPGAQPASVPADRRAGERGAFGPEPMGQRPEATRSSS